MTVFAVLPTDKTVLHQDLDVLVTFVFGVAAESRQLIDSVLSLCHPIKQCVVAFLKV